MFRFFILFSIYTPLFGQVIFTNDEEIRKNTLVIDSSNIEKIELSGTFVDLLIDSALRDSILSDDKERWYQLSAYQLIRILSVSKKYCWPSDSLVKLVHNKSQGYSRDSLILWLEEGGIAGDERKRVEMICLLYTSPSPRDVEESRMPSSA